MGIYELNLHNKSNIIRNLHFLMAKFYAIYGYLLWKEENIRALIKKIFKRKKKFAHYYDSFGHYINSKSIQYLNRMYEIIQWHKT